MSTSRTSPSANTIRTVWAGRGITATISGAIEDFITTNGSARLGVGLTVRGASRPPGASRCSSHQLVTVVSFAGGSLPSVIAPDLIENRAVDAHDRANSRADEEVRRPSDGPGRREPGSARRGAPDHTHLHARYRLSHLQAAGTAAVRGHARLTGSAGEAGEHSDLDFLVIEPEVEDVL